MNMKYFIYRLEITDGEHQYYSSGTCQGQNMQIAIDTANEAARNWYDDEDDQKNITQDGNEYQTWAHQCGCVHAAVDQIEEIPEADYRILVKYPSYL